MVNHPNRGRKDAPGRSPSPAEIRKEREKRNLTQAEAAAVIWHTLRGWQEWEAGNRKMHPSLWRDWLNHAPAP